MTYNRRMSTPKPVSWLIDAWLTVPRLLRDPQAFYDAVTARAEDAISYCDKFALDDMPEDVLNLMRLLYAMVTVSFPVECWKQPRVPDSGATSLDCVYEPVP